MDTVRERRSRQLSWLLRHGANEAGVRMDAAGWVSVRDVLRVARITREELEAIVRENDKQRLQLEEDRVRACQGHSTEHTPVTADALEASWAEHTSDAPLWHGTAASVLPAIAREGLLPIARTHVHLAAALDSVVGKRSAVDVMLKVDPAIVRAHGLRIYAAPNGVILARAVPRAAIVDLAPMTRRARAREHELRAIFGWAASRSGSTA